MAEEDPSSIDLRELKQAGSSMVVIREKSEWSVFPPINHENLQVPTRLSKEDEKDEEEEVQSSPFSSSAPPSGLLSSPDLLSSPCSSSITSSCSTSSFPLSEDGDEAGPLEPTPSDSTIRVQEAGGISGWRRIGFGILASKVRGIVLLPFGCRTAVRGRTFWSLAPAAAVVLWLLYWRFQQWRWRRRRWRAEGRLARLVKEKDEKIAQLLNQIAQMNELLISRQRASTLKLGT